VCRFEDSALNDLKPVTRDEVADFLFLEAELLDAWRLRDWLALFTADARYLVPSPGLPLDASPDDNLFLINDDHDRLLSRINRLSKRSAHAEYPHSLTSHLVSNVRIGEPSERGIPAHAVFLTTRTKNGVTTTFNGRLHYFLATDGADLRIREKRCDLAIEALKPQGRLTILL